MSENTTIEDPVTQLLNGERFRSTPEKALKELQSKGYDTFTMPSLVDALIEAPEESAIWHRRDISKNEAISTKSLVATGWTERGTGVVVYVHTDHYYSDPKNMRRMRQEEILIKDTLWIPNKHFIALVNKDGLTDDLGNTVVRVVDYGTAKNAPSGSVHIEKAVENQRLIGAFGDEKRTEKYLERYQKHFGNHISISQDFPILHMPTGHFLGIAANGCLMDYIKFDSTLGNFAGICVEKRPSLDDVWLCVVKLFSEGREKFETELQKMYSEVKSSGYTDINRPAVYFAGVNFEPRPSLNQVLDLTELLPKNKRALAELERRVMGLYYDKAG